MVGDVFIREQLVIGVLFCLLEVKIICALYRLCCSGCFSICLVLASLHTFCVFYLGTGSGLGTYVLRLLEDEFPDVYRFNVPVYPSQDDDVITSPYNCVLATRQLTEGADCVMPIENQVCKYYDV